MSDSKKQNLSMAIGTVLLAIIILGKFFIGNQLIAFIKGLIQDYI